MKGKKVALADLKKQHMAEWPTLIDVETQGMVFRIGYKPRAREYEAKAKDGQYFSSTSLSSIKAELKAYADPEEIEVIIEDGKKTGSIMNQSNEFFYRPAGTKGTEDSERFHSPQDVRDRLNNKDLLQPVHNHE
jgi:hypothetical protein